VGTDVVRDTVEFFTAFEGMEQGFRNRAQRVLELLSDERTAFVLVAAPRRDAVDEAMYFANRLQESSISIEALIVNRLHPRFGPVPAVLTNPAAASAPEAAPLAGLIDNLRSFDGIARREERYFRSLAGRIAPAPVARVPFLADDVHDLDGLSEVARYLFGDGAKSGAA
jgi:anion-transporting  ArsA/GET3 family ATPase